MGMAEYIEREKAARILREEATAHYPTAFHVGLYAAARVIDSIPAADVRPVVRGRWIRPTRVPDSMLDECSVCGFDTGAYTFNFCPNCGADMRGEQDV